MDFKPRSEIAYTKNQLEVERAKLAALEAEEELLGGQTNSLEGTIQLLQNHFDAHTIKRNSLSMLDDEESYKKEASKLEEQLEPIKHKKNKSPEELFLTLEKASIYRALTKLDKEKYGLEYLRILQEECPPVEEMQRIFKGTQYELNFYSTMSAMMLPPASYSKQDRDTNIQEVENKLGMSLENQKQFLNDNIEAIKRHPPYYSEQNILYFEATVNIDLSKIAFLESDTQKMNDFASKAKQCAEECLAKNQVASNNYNCTINLLSSISLIQAYSANERGNLQEMQNHFNTASNYAQKIPSDKGLKKGVDKLQTVIENNKLQESNVDIKPAQSTQASQVIKSRENNGNHQLTR